MKNLKELMLHPPKLTLALAESMTCGRVQAVIGRIPGASQFFLGGITVYSLDQKVRHLGVNRAAARRVNGISRRVAEEMARGACRLFGSDLAIATTGYAEPAPDSGVLEPFAWWALAHRRRGRFVAGLTGRIECPGENRVDAQQIVAEAVVAELAAYLGGLRGWHGHFTLCS
ncbi:MAG: CinA family protein [Opitutus sp.]